MLYFIISSIVVASHSPAPFAIVVVTQIWGHMCSNLFTTVRALRFHGEKGSALSSLADSRRIMHQYMRYHSGGIQDSERIMIEACVGD